MQTNQEKVGAPAAPAPPGPKHTEPLVPRDTSQARAGE
jgi:hypothetical protein